MAIRFDILLLLGSAIFGTEAFYKKANIPNVSIHTPKTIQELQIALCTKQADGSCDDEPRKIVMKKVFDFTTEGGKTGPACAWTGDKTFCVGGKLSLVISGKCRPGENREDTTYNEEGFEGLLVGSNKFIVGENSGGLKGKGLKLVKSKNVEISNLIITDINPSLFLGGDAIELRGVKNVLIESTYFKNIGGNMIITRFGSSTGVTISSNTFNGQTPYSVHCDGTHMYLWLFVGSAERIRVEHNNVLYTSGRAPYVMAQGDTKTIVHLYKNSFYNHKHLGAINVGDTLSSVLAEGNVYTHVKQLVNDNIQGQVYVVQSESDQVACRSDLGRSCWPNTLVDVGEQTLENSLQVLRDIKQAEAEGNQ